MTASTEPAEWAHFYLYLGQLSEISPNHAPEDEREFLRTEAFGWRLLLDTPDLVVATSLEGQMFFLVRRRAP